MKTREEIYPACRAALDREKWEELTTGAPAEIESFPGWVERRAGEAGDIPAFLPDLARLEEALFLTATPPLS